MKLRIFISIILCLICGSAGAQTIKDASYRTVAHIKSDGTIQDASYHTIGHIRNDGSIQDASYHTTGHLRSDGHRPREI